MTSVLLALLAPAHADWPAGAEIWPALYVDVTREGFASFENIARTLLPPTFPIDSSLIDQSGGASLIIIDVDYSFGVDNLYIIPELVRLTIDPQQGYLDISAVMDVSINTPSDPALLSVDATLGFFGLFDWDVISERCTLYVENARTTVTARIRLGLLYDRFGQQVLTPEGHVKFDIAIEDIAYTLPPLGQEDLHLRSAPGGSCIVDDLVDLADDIFGLDLVEYLMAELTPTLDAQIEQAVADLQGSLDDSLSVLVIEESLDLLGAPLDVSLEPNDLRVTPDGLRMEMVGSFDSGELPHPCISRFDDGLSKQTIPAYDPRYPSIGQTPQGIPRGINALLNDDFLGQAAYAAWRSGLLCQEISDASSSIDLPVPINTSLLSILAPGGFNALFPTPAPLVLRTRPDRKSVV